MSASNRFCAGIGAYFDGDVAGARRLHEGVKRFREIVEAYAPIPAQKRLLALETGDERWANVRPPLTAMPEEQGAELLAALQREFGVDGPF